MKTITRYTEAQIKEMRALKKSGMTIKNIVKKTGYSATAVCKYTSGMTEGNKHLVGTGTVVVDESKVLQKKLVTTPQKAVRVNRNTVLMVDANKSAEEVRAAYERRYSNV